jgi:hypothetical protein
VINLGDIEAITVHVYAHPFEVAVGLRVGADGYR